MHEFFFTGGMGKMATVTSLGVGGWVYVLLYSVPAHIHISRYTRVFCLRSEIDVYMYEWIYSYRQIGLFRSKILFLEFV